MSHDASIYVCVWCVYFVPPFKRLKNAFRTCVRLFSMTVFCTFCMDVLKMSSLRYECVKKRILYIMNVFKAYFVRYECLESMWMS